MNCGIQGTDKLMSLPGGQHLESQHQSWEGGKVKEDPGPQKGPPLSRLLISNGFGSFDSDLCGEDGIGESTFFDPTLKVKESELRETGLGRWVVSDLFSNRSSKRAGWSAVVLGPVGPWLDSWLLQRWWCQVHVALRWIWLSEATVIWYLKVICWIAGLLRKVNW